MDNRPIGTLCSEGSTLRISVRIGDNVNRKKKEEPQYLSTKLSRLDSDSRDILRTRLKEAVSTLRQNLDDRNAPGAHLQSYGEFHFTHISIKRDGKINGQSLGREALQGVSDQFHETVGEILSDILDD